MKANSQMHALPVLSLPLHSYLNQSKARTREEMEGNMKGEKKVDK